MSTLRVHRSARPGCARRPRVRVPSTRRRRPPDRQRRGERRARATPPRPHASRPAGRAADVDRHALHGGELGDDRLLVGGEAPGHRREPRRELLVVGLGPRPPAPSTARDRSGCRDCRTRRICATASGRSRARCRSPGPAPRRAAWHAHCRSSRRASPVTPSARNSPSESQRRCFASRRTRLGAEPPAPGSKRPPPFMSGTIESIFALVPSSRIGKRSVR